MFRFVFIAAVFLLNSVSAFAEGISTHVLDLASGTGGKNIPITLEAKNKAGAWIKIGSGKTDENGRVKSFGSSSNVEPGIYKLIFDMSQHGTKKNKPFFPEITVVFEIQDPKLHYHVPVVVSPYGYSTYRGN